MDGLPYYTMPFVRGESLRASLSRGSLSLEEAIGVLSDVAKALRYAHREGVIHRDIKPENVLLSSGSAVVVDFGIAKALSAAKTHAPGGTLTVVGTSIGTPAYMSPEQAAADPDIDHRADIYAWGVVAYELLAGRHPFEGKKTPRQFLAAHLSEQPSPLATIVTTVPRPVAELVMRCLEKDPERRPQSADDLVAQLGAGSSESIRAPDAVREKTAKWTVPAIAALVLAIAAGGFAAWNYRGATAARANVMLAVLPFENQGPADQEYFVDGLSDAVNGKLAGLAGVSVIDRRSTLQYKKTTKPVKQIGSELGVEYVLGGVVRWARVASGGWRAQVMPTLVNTSNSTTKWAGEPVVVSSDDPFTAQTEIATKVASALQLALGTEDRRELASRPTRNMAAYDAYLRGKSMLEAGYRSSTSVRGLDQAISEFQRAVLLDNEFAQAWAMLAIARYNRAEAVPDDTASMSKVRYAAQRAAALDPNDPAVVDVRSGMAFFSGDRVRARKIISEAVARGIVSPELLIRYAWDLRALKQEDSARAVMDRVLKLNPRHAPVLEEAANMGLQDKDWSRAGRHARSLIALDPTDERGWSRLVQIGRLRGDTAAIRQGIAEAFRYIPAPSNLLLSFMVYAGGEMGLRFTRMTPDQLRIETLEDSIAYYYDNKADLFVGRSEPERARVYYDSIIAKLEGRRLSGPGEPFLRLYLAHSYSVIGRSTDAQRELERMKAVAVALHQVNEDGSPDLDRRVVAGILANTGQTGEAVRELRRLVANSAWTRSGLAQVSKLKALRGNPVFEAFLREKE